MLKHELYKQCAAIIDERIQSIEKAIETAREAAESDTKSSAGDKYETTREMMQQEISRHKGQLLEAKKLKQFLNQLYPDKITATIQPGSLVVTNNGTFYISVAAGKIEVGGNTVFTISPASPIGLKMAGLEPGSTFRFNQKEFVIQEIL